MNEEAARLLLDEMKDGLNNVQDFYGNEFFEYYYMSNVMSILLGVFFILGSIIMLFIWLKDKEYFEYMGIISLFIGAVGTIIIIPSVINQVLLISSPKVYITKEIINMFGQT